ncbi:MAG: Por secretion system protein, partial [Ignavibacterium sp.]
EGLVLVSSDGLRVIANLNSKNSPLLDDKIESLAIDEKTGKVFVGTKFGLNTFETPAIKPVDSFAGLTVYPSPFVISDGSQLVTIDGLIRDSEIKILTVSGKLVRKLETPGGRIAFGDGRDDEGNIVNSGIYIVVASDREANSVETGKIAVIRK